jgi:hypothetical protein
MSDRLCTQPREQFEQEVNERHDCECLFWRAKVESVGVTPESEMGDSLSSAVSDVVTVNRKGIEDKIWKNDRNSPMSTFGSPAQSFWSAFGARVSESGEV